MCVCVCVRVCVCICLGVVPCHGVFPEYMKLRILNLHWKGNSVSFIVETLVLEDAITVSTVGAKKKFPYIT